MGPKERMELEPREGNQGGAGRKTMVLDTLLQKVGMYVPYSCHAPGLKEGQAGLKIQADDKVQLSFLVREKCRSEKLRDNVNIDIASWWQKGLALWSPDFLFISLLMTHFSFGV